MKKEEFLLKLSREELTDEQILEEFEKHYGVERLDQSKWDLQTMVPCCATSARLAFEKLKDVVKAPRSGT